MAPQRPTEINWSSISPEGREVAAHVVARMAAGYTLSEVAAILERERPPLRDLTLPEHVSKGWISSRVRELRAEIRRESGAT